MMTPKSYMTDTERDKLRSEGLSENGILLAESHAANSAGDGETAWNWLALAELPAHTLMSIKTWNGSQFLRDKGFRTAIADATYGQGWLDR
jgi:hypothetical protein